MIEVGQAAPTFALPDENGQKVALEDLRGQWVVVYFYPKDDTPGCTVQACEFTAGLKDFERLGARVLGISPDDAASHQKFIAKHDLGITLLSDPDHVVMAQYGAYGEKMLYGKKSVGVIRSTTIINPDGVAVKQWKSVQAKGHAEKVQAFLESAQAGA